MGIWSNCRAEAVKGRLAMRSWRASPPAALNRDADMWRLLSGVSLGRALGGGGGCGFQWLELLKVN